MSNRNWFVMRLMRPSSDGRELVSEFMQRYQPADMVVMPPNSEGTLDENALE